MYHTLSKQGRNLVLFFNSEVSFKIHIEQLITVRNYIAP